MLTPTLRTGSELSQGEKADIIQRMFAVQNPGERDAMRKSLVTQYGISEGTINSLIAHETMRRKKNAEGAHIGFQEGEVELPPTHVEQEEKTPTQALQQTTQTRAYTITSLSGITEQMREDILEEFSDVIQDNVSNSRYDFYQDIEAISDYYNIDPSILEQFLRNSYKWIGAKLDELRNGRVLTEEEKLMIRLYVSEGIDEKDRKARRKEMAKTYNVSTYVIGAITAWKLNEDGGVVLKKDGLDIDPMVQTLGNRYRTPEIPENVKSNEDLGGQAREPLSELTPADQVAPSNTEQIQDHQIPETSDEAVGEGDFVFSEDDKLFVQELAKDFDLNNDEQRKSFLDDVFDLFPEATIDDVKRVILDFPDDITHANAKRSGEGMGALINYNNEIKNKWRQKLKEFIDENTDREKRATMNVLCLPGMECLEIPLYLELGFRPENIVGVEAGIVQGKKDPEVIARFEANAKRYGIQTRIGRLEKVLETEDTVFDVVSLDFLGPIGKNTFDTLNQIKANNVRYLLLVNFLGKRDSDSVMPFHKAIISDELTKLNLGQKELEDRLDEVDSMDKSLILGISRDSKGITAGLSMQLTRSTNPLPFSPILEVSIEEMKRRIEANFTDKERQSYRPNADITRKVLATHLSGQIALGLQKFFSGRIPEGMPIFERESLLEAIPPENIYLYLYNYFAYYTSDFSEYCMLLFGYKPTIQSSRRYRYNTSSPMFSDFLVIEPVQPKIILPLKTLNAFLLSFIRGAGIHSATIYLRTSNGKQVNYMDRIKYSDIIKIAMNGYLIAQFRVKDLIGDIEKMNHILRSQGHIIQSVREKLTTSSFG